MLNSHPMCSREQDDAQTRDLPRADHDSPATRQPALTGDQDYARQEGRVSESRRDYEARQIKAWDEFHAWVTERRKLRSA